jgi:hypothetical protein
MNKHRYQTIIVSAAILTTIMVVLFIQTMGIQYATTNSSEAILDSQTDLENKPLASTATCLLLYDSSNDTSSAAQTLYEDILTDMRISYDSIDIATQQFPSLTSYSTLVIATPNLDTLDTDISEIEAWTSAGGSTLIGISPQQSDSLDAMAEELGFSASGDMVAVSTFTSTDDFMLGSAETYSFEDPVDSSINFKLTDDVELKATTEDGATPLIWSHAWGSGTFVTCNFGYIEKAYRGIFASAYSLLSDYCIYPVINASTYYLDDFPSPVPEGDATYIERDYQMSIADFYSTIWWPDVLALSEKHNFNYTGAIIETYENQTSGDLERNDDTSTYRYFGNMLLSTGGELALHGYNHQPLCLDDFNYTTELSYRTWSSLDEIISSLKELESFSSNLFSDVQFSVYVPPSNILSSEARAVIGEQFTSIKAIASTYAPGGDTYSQEFEIASDGVIEMPRIVSGEDISDYDQTMAFCEMNLHFVNSHFMHPDDVLDVDRGAAEGWETLKSELDDYMSWVDETAPSIRHLTASGMAGAVQRYASVEPQITETDSSIDIHIDNFTDSCYLFLRINDESSIGTVEGATLTKLNGTLYLLECNQADVHVERQAS